MVTSARVSRKAELQRLRLFASLCIGREAGDALLIAYVGKSPLTNSTQRRLDLYRGLHQLLRPRLGPDAARSSCPTDCGGGGLWNQFDQLPVTQRAATFLIFGLDLTVDEAAYVLDETPELVGANAVAALFCLEHIIPFRAVGAVKPASSEGPSIRPLPRTRGRPRRAGRNIGAVHRLRPLASARLLGPPSPSI